MIKFVFLIYLCQKITDVSEIKDRKLNLRNIFVLVVISDPKLRPWLALLSADPPSYGNSLGVYHLKRGA